MLLKSDLFKLLKLKGLDFQIHSHEPLFTVEDSEKLRGQIKGAHTKNLFLKSKKNQFYLFSCDEKAKVDLKLFSKSINAKNLSFAKESYLEKYLGIKPGSVSPFALLNPAITHGATPNLLDMLITLIGNFFFFSSSILNYASFELSLTKISS